MPETLSRAEIDATHRDLSDLAARFAERAAEDPELRRPWDWKSTDLPEWVLRYAYPLQSWPLFLDADKEGRIEAATVAVSELVRSIPERVFDNDAERMAAHIGFPDPGVLAFLLEPPNGLESSLARCDLIDTGDSLRCVELNLGANLGGWQLRFWADPCVERPPLRRFLDEHGAEAEFVDPLARLFRHTCSDIRANGVADREVNLCLMIPRQEYPFAVQAGEELGALYRRVLDEEGAGVGGRLLIVSEEEPPTARGRSLWHDGVQVHGLVEYTGNDTPRRIYRCFMAGTVRLYNGPLAPLLGNKQMLAVLSSHADSDCFDRRERELIEAHVPWSRELGPGRADATRYLGETVQLLPFATAHRERLVLKPSAGRRGQDVFIGAHVADDLWKRKLESAAAAGGWVLQEYSPSRPYLFQHGDEGHAPHDVVWGTFCFGSTYAGGFLRMMPREGGDGVINSARGAVEGLYYGV